jgi:hypothetical protein
MFPYDPTLLAAVETSPQSIPGVLEIMESIDSTCADGDGLKWFNWLYLQVTRAVEVRVNSSDPQAAFANPAWIAALDVEFASFYFSALRGALSGGAKGQAPGCWLDLFAVRNQTALARIQFALAGMNAHINRDLPQAVLASCRAASFAPLHGVVSYNDFTALNSTLDSLIDEAKKVLRVRLLGDKLPPISVLDDALAAWSIAAARETAWNNAELLDHLAATPPIAATFLDTLDGFTALAGKALLVPVP